MNRRTLVAGLLLGLGEQRRCTGHKRFVQTVTGRVPATAIGTTLIHEHVVADLRAPADRGKGDYDAGEAERIALPHLRELRNRGCITLVDPTPINMGRDPVLLQRLSLLSGIKIICATGFFGAAGHRYLPEFARKGDAEELAHHYVREANEGVGLSRIRPGIIKTGVNPDAALSGMDERLVRAAALACRSTGLTIFSHTGPGAPAFEQLQVLQSLGVPPSAFVWVHADNERDHRLHIRAARMGAWVEFDSLNRQDFFDWHLRCLREMAAAGVLNRTLISQDAGHYQPGVYGGGAYRPYSLLFDAFLPRLRDIGFHKREVDQVLIENPARALVGAQPPS